VQKTVVESDMALTRRSLKEAGFDDRQAQALVDVSGPAAERRTLQADVAELKRDVASLNERFDDLRDEFVSFRAEMREDRAAFRAEMREDRAAFRAEMQGQLVAFRAEMQGQIAELRTETQGQIAELRTETQGRIAELRTEMRTEFAKVHGRIDGLEGQLKLMLWFMGIGLTLYTGTTISLMILLFRSMLT